jgi:hypothetical protein
MEDLAVSIMSLSHSAPLYLFFDVPAWEEYWLHGGSFELAAAGAKSVSDDKENNSAVPRACASDVSTAFAGRVFRGGALLPLKLPPRLQHPADWSAATSPTGQQLARVPSWSPFTSSRRHRGFDPFAAALEKVRRDRVAPAPTMRRARSLSPLRGAADAAKSLSSSRLAGTTAPVTAQQKASGRPPRKSTSTRRRGVKHLLCWAVMASSDAAPRGLRTRCRRDGNAPDHRPSFLICFGF